MHSVFEFFLHLHPDLMFFKDPGYIQAHLMTTHKDIWAQSKDNGIA